MKDKIIARLKALYPGVNLSKERLNAIADKLEPKITDENLIDERLNDLNDIYAFSDIAKQDDRLRTAEKKQAADDQKQETAEQKAAREAEGKKDDEMPAWAKQLSDDIAGLKAEKTQQNIKQQFAEKLKDVPAVFYKGRTPEKQEDIETAANEVLSDWSELKQAKTELGIEKPVIGGQKIADKTVDTSIDKWIAKT